MRKSSKQAIQSQIKLAKGSLKGFQTDTTYESWCEFKTETDQCVHNCVNVKTKQNDHNGIAFWSSSVSAWSRDRNKWDVKTTHF